MKFIKRLSPGILLLILFLPVLTSAQNDQTVAAYGILVDNTRSLTPESDNIKILCKTLVQKISQRGTVSLFSFETRGDSKNPFAAVKSGTEWSQDKNQSEKFADSLTPVSGQTALFDAISAVGKAVEAKSKTEKLPEKIIILITDGDERASALTEKELFKELKESGVKVYAIGLVQNLETYGAVPQQTERGKATNFLKKLAKETGGNAIFPKLKKGTKVEDVLTELFAESKK